MKLVALMFMFCAFLLTGCRSTPHHAVVAPPTRDALASQSTRLDEAITSSLVEIRGLEEIRDGYYRYFGLERDSREWKRKRDSLPGFVDAENYGFFEYLRDRETLLEELRGRVRLLREQLWSLKSDVTTHPKGRGRGDRDSGAEAE